MFEVGFAVIKKGNADEGGVENTEKLIQPNWEEESLMSGFVSGHHQAVLHETEEEKAEDPGGPIGVDFQKPKICCYKRISGKDMGSRVEVALVFPKLGDLLPQIHITL